MIFKIEGLEEPFNFLQLGYNSKLSLFADKPNSENTHG